MLLIGKIESTNCELNLWPEVVSSSASYAFLDQTGGLKSPESIQATARVKQALTESNTKTPHALKQLLIWYSSRQLEWHQERKPSTTDRRSSARRHGSLSSEQGLAMLAVPSGVSSSAGPPIPGRRGSRSSPLYLRWEARHVRKCIRPRELHPHKYCMYCRSSLRT